MNWECIRGKWKRIEGSARRQWRRRSEEGLDAAATRAREKQLAEWLAREHKIDPIHK